MIKFFNSKKMLFLSFAMTVITGVFMFFYSAHSIKKGFNLSCSVKGIISVNGYTLTYVSSYRFKRNHKGATALTGKLEGSDGSINNVGLQIYFDYNIDSGMLMLRTTNIVRQVENTASEEVIKKVFPSVYYRINNVHNVAIFKMGSGYRFDFNTYPVMYCY
ncbi:TPA: hypothetical protein OMS29_004946 [Klebsiella aerogenes]|nr:hypothetical protein [Klebsiella oxytoca]HCR0085257.1 hypothetical protein [Klebsiella aerogenes]HCR0223758.1 hypothetical protein [Klebsiella aerogenes]HCR0512064.1 hypothetical protein [Klebsiella aerogenes]HCU2336698.1 hypothetical protein [Klebsiella aerogenes]